MSSARNCLILGITAMGFAAMNGCWVDSSVGTPAANTPLPQAGSAQGGAQGGGSPTPTAGSAMGGASAGSAPTGGSSPTAGSPAGGAPAGGGGSGGASAGAPAGGDGSGGAPACPAPTGTHQATALSRSCFIATASDCSTNKDNPDEPARALDASLITRFSTGAKMLGQANPYVYKFDMGSAVSIAGIKLVSNATDFAATLTVEVSTDNTTWKSVACGTGTATTDFSFAATTARYVRLTQGGMNDGWWSVYDLNVYGATGTETTCAAGTGATSTACTTPHA